MIKRIMLIVAAIIAAFAMASCTVDTPSDGTLVHKGGGIIEAADPKGCVIPASKEISKPGDSYYLYPTSQRYYAFNASYRPPAEEGQASTGADGPPITVVSKDGQTLTISGTLSFNLNTNCDVLQRFHDNVGNREHAYFDSTDRVPQGWTNLLNTYMRPPLDATLDRVAKQYDWKSLYSDVTIKDKMNEEINRQISTLINERFTGADDYFLNFSSLVLQPTADADLVASVKQKELSVAQAQATQSKAEADAAAAEAAAKSQVAQKKAELTVAQLQAQIKAAEIQAYGGVKNWLDSKAIEKGLNPWQPTYSGGALVDTTK